MIYLIHWHLPQLFLRPKGLESLEERPFERALVHMNLNKFCINRKSRINCKGIRDLKACLDYS